MNKKHENYKELVMRLAKTDFKLRYHDSFLGYIWAILKPLLIFTVLNFVFSSIFNFKNSGTPLYSLELLTALMLFNFFAEGTTAGMRSLISKAQLVTKTYVPRWTIVVSSTINSLFVFLMNLIVIILFFAAYGVLPSIGAIIIFLLFVVLLSNIVLAFSFLTATVFVRFRDLSMIWEVVVMILMYISPVVYPLSLMPENLQKIMLFNPLGFIIHFTKQALISGHFATVSQIFVLIAVIFLFMGGSILWFNRSEKTIAEYM